MDERTNRTVQVPAMTSFVSSANEASAAASPSAPAKIAIRNLDFF